VQARLSSIFWGKTIYVVDRQGWGCMTTSGTSLRPPQTIIEA